MGVRELSASTCCLPVLGGMGDAWGPAAPSGCPQYLCSPFALAAMLGEQAAAGVVVVVCVCLSFVTR